MRKNVVRRFLQELVVEYKVKRALRYRDFLYTLEPGFYIYKPSYEYKMIMMGKYDELIRYEEELRKKIQLLD